MFLAKKYLTKVAQTFYEGLGYFETKHFLQLRPLWLLFGQVLTIIGHLLFKCLVTLRPTCNRLNNNVLRLFFVKYQVYQGDVTIQRKWYKLRM